MTNIDLAFILKVRDDATAAFKKVGSQLGTLKTSLEGVGTTMLATGGAIVGGLGLAVKAAADAEVAQNRFETVLKNVSKATDDQVASLRQQQDALQATTRFEGDAIASAQAFLGTFALTAGQVGELTPKLLDMAEGMRKASGGTINLEAASNMLGKAIANGSLASLKDVGITIPGVNAAQQELFMKTFQLANQQERVAMVAKLVDGNFKGLAVSAGQTLSGQMDILNNQFGDLMETIGNQLIPILSNVLNNVRPVITGIMEWVAANPQLVEQIVTVAAVAGPLIAGLGALGVVISTVAGAIGTLISIGGALIGVVGAISAPVIGVIAVFTALVAAGVLVYKNWDTIKEKALAIWGAIAEFFRGIWDTIVGVFKFAVALIIGALDAYLSTFDSNWKQHLAMLLSTFKQLWEGIKAAFQFFVSVFMPMVMGFLSNLLGTVNEYVEPIVGAFSTIWNLVKSTAADAFEALKGIISSSVNWIIDKVNTVIDAINAVAAAGAKVAGISAPQIAKIPKLANGGIVTSPTLALIGEAGPEAVVPLSGPRAAAAGVGGTTVNISIGSFIGGNPEAAAREIGDLIIKRLQMNARVS